MSTISIMKPSTNKEITLRFLFSRQQQYESQSDLTTNAMQMHLQKATSLERSTAISRLSESK